MFLTIRKELQYDQFHQKTDRIVRVTQIHAREGGDFFQPFMPYPAGRAIREDFPDFEAVTQVQFNGEGIIRLGKNKFQVDDVLFADEYFLKVFDYAWIQGNPSYALQAPNTVVLTESLAALLFGAKDPVDQVIQLDELLKLRVTGVVKDPPETTNIPFSMLVSFSSFSNDYFPLDMDIFAEWGFTDKGAVFAVLPENKRPQDYDKALATFIQKYYHEDMQSFLHHTLQPLEDIHFDMRYAARNPAEPSV